MASSSNAQLELEVADLSRVVARVVAGRIAAGETVTFRYENAIVDRFAEQEERFYFKVDGNGDGFFVPIADYPLVNILPSAPARVCLTASSFPGADGSCVLHVAALDVVEDRAARDVRLLPRGHASPCCSGLPIR